MLENYIIVKDVEQKELELALSNLADLYFDTVYVQGIKLYQSKSEENTFLILFSNQPDVERFNYFVNYIRYPEELSNFNPSLRGYYKVLDLKEKFIFSVGSYVMVYVSAQDKDYDNVNVVNENNETFIYDFGARIKKLDNSELDFELVSPNIVDYDHISTISLDPKLVLELPKEPEPWWKIW